MEALKDERFAHITKDPRFHKMPRQERKVKIDKRFDAMFKDKKFNVKYSVDKRGRPQNLTSNENLKRFYELSDSDDDDSDSGDDDNQVHEQLLTKTSISAEKLTDTKNTDISKKKKEKANILETVSSKSKAHVEALSKNDITNIDSVRKKEKNHLRDAIKKKKKKQEDGLGERANGVGKFVLKEMNSDSVVSEGPDLARGEGNEESSSEEEAENSEELEEVEEEEETKNEDIDHCWGEMDKDAPATSVVSSRLAVCNMDWDRIKAMDIYVLLNSFKPPNGIIYSVKIYPSEFGLQRMKEEEQIGPIELVEVKDALHNHNTEDAEGSSYHDEKLRQYQLNRLKYYYAVVECDSPNTANTIYEECDGMEYECSSTRLDLRFIPQDMTFDQEPKSECKEMPDSSTYKPSLFFTTALAQSKVDLTWDETDRERVSLMMQKFNDIKDLKEDDFQAYLASSSDDEDQSDYKQLLVGDDEESEGDEGEEKMIQKYKSLVHEIQEKEEKKASKHDAELEITWEPGLKSTTEDIIKKKQKAKDATPWQEYLQKNKEKKKAKRGEKLAKKKEFKSLGSNRAEEPQQAMDDNQAAFSDDELPDDVDLSDPFFSRGTEGKRKKKKKKGTDIVEPDEKGKKEKAELSLLLMDDEVDKHHFKLENLVQDTEAKKKRKKKREADQAKKSKEADFQVNVKDDRFRAVYDSHLFNIDPSAPEFRRTKGMEAMIEEKLKRSNSKKAKKIEEGMFQKTALKRKAGTSLDMIGSDFSRQKISVDSLDTAQTEQSLASLVKSVKSKTQKFYTKNTK